MLTFKEYITEARAGSWKVIRDLVPKHWPDYVVKDMLYRKLEDEADLGTLKREINRMLTKEMPVKQWKLETIDLTKDSFDKQTTNNLKRRAGGKKNPWGVPKDAERHAAQSNIIKTTGKVSPEPIIVLQRKDGFEILEGWHRTIQNLIAFPDGYKQRAWVGYL
jgi:hypothetical protein